MTFYMTQFAYTPEAWAKFTKNPEDRTTVVKNLLESFGCRFEALYYQFGEYDGAAIFEAPDEAAATSFILAALGPGHIRACKTTVLMRPNVVVEAMKKAGAAKYRGPNP